MSNQYIIKNNYAELIINSKTYGKITIFVDVDLVERLKQHIWYIQNFNSKTVATSINKKNIFLHRFITNCPDGLEVDHINHNRADNRKANLKICTHKENMNNLFPNCKRGKYIFRVRVKFRVRVPENGKNKHLGYFNTFEEAQAKVKEHIDNLWNLYSQNYA